MGHTVCCTPGFGVRRRYLSRDERAQILEEYASDLENELKGVRERIQELRGE